MNNWKNISKPSETRSCLKMVFKMAATNDYSLMNYMNKNITVIAYKTGHNWKKYQGELNKTRNFLKMVHKRIIYHKATVDKLDASTCYVLACILGRNTCYFSSVTDKISQDESFLNGSY